MARKPGASKKTGTRNRRKSRELVLKAVYRGMLNESELSQIFRDMTDDPDYNKADEAYFKQLGVELAKVFGGTDGHKYINGVLDKLSADVREAEVKAAKA
ncbi:MAG: hypothetical protein B7Y34_06610 [Methylophilales bacterium 16-45-9]|nr:MAG: hypothetical protein B7Y34_06610 [Methylophilales bacterium 16-45-9]